MTTTTLDRAADEYEATRQRFSTLADELTADVEQRIGH